MCHNSTKKLSLKADFPLQMHCVAMKPGQPHCQRQYSAQNRRYNAPLAPLQTKRTVKATSQKPDWRQQMLDKINGKEAGEDGKIPAVSVVNQQRNMPSSVPQRQNLPDALVPGFSGQVDCLLADSSYEDC